MIRICFIFFLLLILPCTALSADKSVDVVPFVDLSPNKPVDVLVTDMQCAAAFQGLEKELASRAEKLARREAMLGDLEKELDMKIAELEVLQKDLGRKLAVYQEKTDEDFKDLVKVYRAMRGSKAAPLLNRMSSENAARMLKAMDSEKVADIIPRLDEGKAVEVSRIMGSLK